MVWVVGDAIIDGGETGTSFKQALYFKEVGFNLHDTMIYQKHNFSKPSSNRYHQIFEYMFIFSKGKPKTFNPLKDRQNIYAGTGRWGRNSARQKDGTLKKEIESDGKVNTDFGMRLNIWRLKTEMKPLHPAQFPEQLANDHIISWSNKDDLVYDPFTGSGTTAKMAKINNRNFIGSEISVEYYTIAEKRLSSIHNKYIF